MRRVFTCNVVVVIAALIPSSLQAAPPTDAEIAQALKDLGDTRFTVREKATKLLWEAGKRAEPGLLQALRSNDAETVRRAKQLLERFSWGIFPDTPKAIVELITQFRDGSEDVRTDVIGKLIPLGRPGIQTIQRLTEHAKTETERTAIRKMLSANIERGIPPLLLAGENALVDELLELCIDEVSFAGATNYAALHYLTGTLAATVARWEKQRANHAHDARIGVTLVHLYRAGGDFAKAHALAATLDNKRLVEDLLWEEGRWPELARFYERSPVADRSGRALGARVAYYRLAGDAAGQAKMLTELRKAVDTTDPFLFFAAVEGLLLNGHSSEAIQLLIDRKIRVAVAFELLAAQLKCREALALANEIKGLTPPEQFELNLARARQLHLLGERDQALQLFTQLGSRFETAAEAADVQRLLKVLTRLRLHEPALEMAARFLALCEKQRHAESLDEILEPLFADHGAEAETWWRFLRAKHPTEDAAATMKKLRALLQGKPVAEREGWIKELTANNVATGVPIRSANGTLLFTTEQANLAVAAVLRAAGAEPMAETYLLKASQDPGGVAALRYADFCAEKKRFADAASWYQKAAQRTPANPLPHFLYGWALEKSGQEMAGRKAMAQAHVLPLGNEQVRMEFANQLAKRGFDAAARKECALVRQIGWYREWYVGNVLNQIARDANKARDFALAAACFEKSLLGYLRNELVTFVDSSAYISVPQTVVQLRARAALAAGRPEDASKLLHQALAELPGDIELIIQVLPELEKTGHKKEADALFHMVFERYQKQCADFPNSALAHNSIAWMSANCRRQLDDAVKHAETAVRLDPKNAGYLDTLAEVHFRRGDQAKALDLMKQCVALEPKRSYFRQQLERYAKGNVSSPVPDSQDD